MKIKINGIFYVKDEIPDGSLSILQACEEFGFNIPKFCYHPKLSIAGNCRMCLVEVEGAPKPVASCAMPQSPTTSVFLDTPLVKKARESVMEFLLLNHPLDCPVCDQGGECDLQDEALLFGNDRGRFFSTRRSVVNKNTGPLVKMVMTRCIHCTRCVRFSSEISGFSELGATGRGNSMEIGPYVDRVLKTELSGNVIDLCPVGALTSKPYAFSGRPWEAKSMDSVDTSDSMGTPITVQVRKNTITKVVPRDNTFISLGWIHDRTRFSYDGVSVQRITHPLVRLSGGLTKKSFLEGLVILKSWFLSKNDNKTAVIPAMVFFNTATTAGMLTFFKAVSVFYYNTVSFFTISEFGSSINSDFRHLYAFNTTFQKFGYADTYVLLGSDLRYESPILHTQLISVFKTGVKIAYYGKYIDSKICTTQRSLSTLSVYNLLTGRDTFCQTLVRSIRPFILTNGSFARISQLGLKVNALVSKLACYTRITSSDFSNKINWCGINALLHSANAFLAYELHSYHRYNNLATALTKNTYNSVDKLFYNTDFRNNIPTTTKSLATSNLFIGTHFSARAAECDFVIPMHTSYEETGVYVNNEGRAQITQGVISPEGECLTESTFKTVLGSVVVADLNLEGSSVSAVDSDLISLFLKVRLVVSLPVIELLVPYTKNFYQTDFVALNSVNMAKARLANYPKNFALI